jgi:FixJ family two-component response regulator
MERERPLIAIVDDEGSVRTSLRRLLHAWRLDTVAFASGQEFLDSLPAARPDCLILDLQMPGLSGDDVQRRLVELQMEVPTIVITAADGSSTRPLPPGAVACLYKPFEEAVLLATIAKAVHASRDS